MKNLIKSIIKPIYYLFVDEYAFDSNIPLFTRLWVTVRCKFAARGVFLNDNERRIAALKDIHKGERCFIIGNGPSLNKLDLSKIKDEYTFGVNAIYLNHRFLLESLSL